MKRYFVEYVSDRYNRNEYDREKGEYGSYNHEYGSYASTIKTAKSYIRRIRKDRADENPRNFRIYDRYADDVQTGFLTCVYQED